MQIPLLKLGGSNIVVATGFAWFGIVFLVGLILHLPSPLKWLLWVLYEPLLLAFIHYVNKNIPGKS